MKPKIRRKPTIDSLFELVRLTKDSADYQCGMCDKIFEGAVPDLILSEAKRHWKKEHRFARDAIERGGIWLSKYLSEASKSST